MSGDYAHGKDWVVTIRRHPLSLGYQVVLVHEDGSERIIGNKMGYARPRTAERLAGRTAEKLWDREEPAP